ncbi:DNA primase [Candidatus Wolfebacteria bacterium CG10_big_fil_rev_8_21_14_0_10_31_9]|uniref:DNA primase n=1 Tax=Candidatus Wolfebacteria bacterium CG10_big_fil_rev_8_21_14_0_10_31_9 TaxID=1975070 RepID=A0A2H0RC60_9BACT|nr:MAG: DNA primase [Candidatus Wolfebacteria bacterium CG10_big_fil_rev_8_21_14_0_10_31_9]
MTPVEQIKDKLDIVSFIRQYVELKPSGRNFKASCPFHKEKTPSFMIFTESQSWHCFGSCAEGGDIFKFIMKYDNIEFYEALKMLAEKAGIELKKISPIDQKQFGVLYDINASAKDIFRKELGRGARAQEYLKDRGLKKETADEFEIGFAPQNLDELTVNLINMGYDIKDIERAGLNFKTEKGGYIDRFRGRVMFPIYNHFGKVVGFSGRILPELDTGETGKYINSPETSIFNKSKTLYGFHKSKNHIHEQKLAILVEGQMDFLMAWQDGVNNVVATSGTALTEDHLKTLKRQTDELVLCFDSDEAGIKAAERSIDMANNLDFNVKILVLEEFKDPAEAVVKKPGALSNMIKSAKPAMEFYFDRYIVSGLNNSPSDIKRGARAVLAKINDLFSPIDRSHWIKKLANKTGVDEKALLEEMDQIKKPEIAHKNVSSQTAPENKILTRLDRIAERLISISISEESFIPEIKDYYEYLPENYKSVYRYVANSEKSSDIEINNLVHNLFFKSGVDNDDNNKDKSGQEFYGLLKHLKMEFLKNKLTELTKELKEAEITKDEERLSSVRKQFDEVSKMRQTEG